MSNLDRTEPLLFVPSSEAISIGSVSVVTKHPASHRNGGDRAGVGAGDGAGVGAGDGAGVGAGDGAGVGAGG